MSDETPQAWDEQDRPPADVERLLDRARVAVHRAVGVEPDLTPETLPLVDAFLREVVSGLETGQRVEMLAAVGAYFGEVVRRRLGARWALVDDPFSWRVELRSCFLHFRPVGMAGEVMLGCESEEYDGSFATLDELHDELSLMLEQAAPMPEDEYYSLAGRLEVLALVADWLVGRAAAKGGEPGDFTAADYRETLGEEAPE